MKGVGVMIGRVLVVVVVCTQAGLGIGLPRATASGLVPFSSLVAPFGMGYPQGWRHQIFIIGAFAGDIFQQPIIKGNFRDNINVYSPDGVVPITYTEAMLVRGTARALAETGMIVRNAGTALVLGRYHLLITYRESSGVLPLQVTQMMMVAGRRSWYFTLTARVDDEATLRHVFVAMLTTFHLHV